MKQVLRYVLVSVLATAMALASASTLAAPAEALNIVEQENAKADAALNAMAIDIIQKHGKDAAPALLANRLGVLRALCEGVDPTRLAQAMAGNDKGKSAKPQPLRIQSMELQRVKIKHPLCRRLTAQAI